MTGKVHHVGRVCALVLAGGRSRRMGSDKALLPADGETLLDRAVGFWRSCEKIENVIVSVGAAEHFKTLPADVLSVPDLYPGMGPMAGIHAAFSLTDAELLYVSGVDMPFLQKDALLPVPAGDAAVYVSGGRPEPLFGVYRRSALPALDAALRAGRRKMSELLEQLDTEYTALPEALAPTVVNLNTREDYLRACAGSPPMVGFTGWSGSGKTTFLEKLLPELTGRGLRVAVVKHDAHSFQMDRPGKDTWRMAQAGAVCTAISGPNGWAVLGKEQVSLEDLRPKLASVDIILVEGYKYGPLPKIEIHRRAAGKPFITRDPTLLAAVTDEPLDVAAPQLGLEDASACAELICKIFLRDDYDEGKI